MQITFAQLSFVLSGAKIIVSHRDCEGDLGEELYRGTIEDLHIPSNRELHDRIDKMVIMFIDAVEGELVIGVAEI